MNVGDVLKHYKGGEYVVLAKARMSENRDEEVIVYRSLETGQVWVRPAAMFTELVEVGEETKLRFQKIDFQVVFIDQYQELASRTASKTNTDMQELVLHSLGVAGESGETTDELMELLLFSVMKMKLYGRAAAIADFVKKIFGHGHPFDETAKKKIAKELGDVKWYTAMLAKVVGLKESVIATQNIKKLWERYPEGFSSERSMNRSE
jgi:NTP pyrophosphatase (non-canonical NTP hydrolase)